MDGDKVNGTGPGVTNATPGAAGRNGTGSGPTRFDGTIAKNTPTPTPFDTPDLPTYTVTIGGVEYRLTQLEDKPGEYKLERKTGTNTYGPASKESYGKFVNDLRANKYGVNIGFEGSNPNSIKITSFPSGVKASDPFPARIFNAAGKGAGAAPAPSDPASPKPPEPRQLIPFESGGQWFSLRPVLIEVEVEKGKKTTQPAYALFLENGTDPPPRVSPEFFYQDKDKYKLREKFNGDAIIKNGEKIYISEYAARNVAAHGAAAGAANGAVDGAPKANTKGPAPYSLTYKSESGDIQLYKIGERYVIELNGNPPSSGDIQAIAGRLAIPKASWHKLSTRLQAKAFGPRRPAAKSMELVDRIYDAKRSQGRQSIPSARFLRHFQFSKKRPSWQADYHI